MQPLKRAELFRYRLHHRAAGILECEVDERVHGFGGGLRIAGGNGIVHPHVIGNGIAREHARTLLELRRPVHRRADARTQNHEGIVARRMENGVVEIAVGRPARLRRQRVLAHGGKRVLHDLEIGFVPPLRRQARSGRLDDGTQFEQAAHEFDVGLPGEGPAQHFRVEQVPAVAREDARTGLGTAGNQPLGREHLDRLAVGASRNLQFLGKGDFTGENIAGCIFARQDVGTQLVGNGTMQAPPRPAGFLRRLSLCVIIGNFSFGHGF